MNIKLIILLLIVLFLVGVPVYAHCPLCTAGAGLAAIAASQLGVGAGPIGIFIGAFSVALGLWIAKIIKKQYVPRQKALLVAISFLTTVLPLMPLMREYSSLYISLAGDYGSFLNRTYIINRFLIGALVGGAILFIAPLLSGKIAALRKGVSFPYQGLMITFALLAVCAAIFELIW